MVKGLPVDAIDMVTIIVLTHSVEIQHAASGYTREIFNHFMLEMKEQIKPK